MECLRYKSPLVADDVRLICSENGLEIPDFQWHILTKWADLLIEINQKVNLISRKETDYLWEKQILSCLSLLIFRRFSEASEICDFGTGGGLPGMLIAIVRPDLFLTLLDSRQNKVKVVRQMIETLKIKNAQIVCGRGEELGKDSKWFQRFPFVTSRAVAPIKDIVRWTSDLRNPESEIHLFKGGEIINEEFALSKEFSGYRIKKSLINLKGFSKFAQNQKYLVSIKFNSD